MTKDELNQFLKLYEQRYGEWSMQDETIEMWWRNLHDQDVVHTAEAFDILIGKHQKKFGWELVLEVIESKHPKGMGMKALEDEWKKEPVKEGDSSKRDMLVAVMRDLISRNVKEPFDWVAEYAEHFVLIWGCKAAENLIKTYENNPKYREFEILVKQNIKKFEG